MSALDGRRRARIGRYEARWAVQRRPAWVWLILRGDTARWWDERRRLDEDYEVAMDAIDRSYAAIYLAGITYAVSEYVVPPSYVAALRHVYPEPEDNGSR